MLTAGSAFAFFKLKNTALTSNAIYQSGMSNQSQAKNDQSQMSNHSQAMGRDIRAVTTINGLHRISVIGSTAFIVDGHGRTISADPNPYGKPRYAWFTHPGSDTDRQPPCFGRNLSKYSGGLLLFEEACGMKPS